ncbi:suppressor protein sef1 [Talaromyces marneffei ATCC 18224]
MPPIRDKKSKDLIEQEGRILLAISNFRNGKIPTIATAARIYKIPRTTLRNRLHGIQQRSLVRANNHKLTQHEEKSLVKWVLDLDQRGSPPPALSCTRNGQLSSLTTWKSTSWRELGNQPD